MGHKNHLWVTKPIVRHYGRISYEEKFARLSDIKIVQVKYIIISVSPNSTLVHTRYYHYIFILLKQYPKHRFYGVLSGDVIFLIVQAIQNCPKEIRIDIQKCPSVPDPDQLPVQPSTEQSLWSCPSDMCYSLLLHGYNVTPLC